MIRGSLARRYARALMAIGQDKGIYRELGDELKQLSRLAGEDATFRLVITAPIINKEARDKVIEALAPALGLNEVMVRFLKLLNKKGRLPFLEQISMAYEEMVDEALGRVRAEVVSARPLSEEAGAKIRAALADFTGKEVLMQIEVDDTLIGGVTARVAGKLLDGSVKTQLKAVEERLKAAGA